MQARVRTVAFQGVDVLPVDVQVLVAPGQLAFAMVGLADKAVGESRERVRAALARARARAAAAAHLGQSLAGRPRQGGQPLRPADRARRCLAAMGVIAKESLAGFVALGELALDGSLTRVPGVLPAAIAAAAAGRGVICPAACGGEAAWAWLRARDANDVDRPSIVAAPSLLALINHLRGQQLLPAPQALIADDAASYPDLAEIKGQETAKRVLEVAAAGGHNLLMIGPPGSGKSMLAARLPGLLPPLDADEALEATMVRSLAGELGDGKLSRRRSFRDPHHSATLQALVGGGLRARPGEVSLAHHGVLFLDELPEFNRATLEALRQPLESGRVTVARANAHVTYPARFQLVAAMNPVPLRPSDGAQPRLRPRAALRRSTIRASCRARCSTASIWHRRAAGRARPISPCRRRPKVPPTSPPASPPRAPSSASAWPSSTARASFWPSKPIRPPASCRPGARLVQAALQCRHRRRAAGRHRRARRRRPRTAHAAPPSGSASRPAPGIARCGSPAPWPISTAPMPCAACISPRP